MPDDVREILPQDDPRATIWSLCVSNSDLVTQVLDIENLGDDPPVSRPPPSWAADQSLGAASSAGTTSVAAVVHPAGDLPAGPIEHHDDIATVLRVALADHRSREPEPAPAMRRSIPIRRWSPARSSR